MGPINYPLNSFFKSCEVSLNNKQISSGKNHPYRAIIETLLNWNKNSKESHLASGCFFKDEKMDSLDFSED